jgi:hypothetical protein
MSPQVKRAISATYDKKLPEPGEDRRLGLKMMLLRRLLLPSLVGLALLAGKPGLASNRLRILGRPAPETQLEKTVAERGGVNPCATAEPGFGSYDPWEDGPTLGHLLAPHRGGLTEDGQFDLMIHFHGHEPARKEWTRVMSGAVFVGIDLGTGSGVYAEPFETPGAFEQLISSVESAMATRSGRQSTKVRHLGLSSWSAGYGAIRQILRSPDAARRVDTVMLLDSLHADYRGDSLDEQQMAPFTGLAQSAARGEGIFFLSHSSITPPGYASTTETARFLVADVGGMPRRAHKRAGDPYGLELVTRFSKGNFHVRGFSGNGALDHCAQFGMYGQALRVYVKPRWKSPTGRKSTTK